MIANFTKHGLHDTFFSQSLISAQFYKQTSAKLLTGRADCHHRPPENTATCCQGEHCHLATSKGYYTLCASWHQTIVIHKSVIY